MALVGLLWGSFLNVVAYRIIRHESIAFPRSHCPHCNHTLAWYDLVPLFSWLALKGSCRYCAAPISFLYPFIELLTASLFVLLYNQFDLPYILSYGLFFSALIVSIRTDLEHLLISRLASLCLVPIGIMLAISGWLPITGTESCLGAIFGYALLWGTAVAFKRITKKEGIGEGDFELMAMIGSFTGPMGVWLTITAGSLIGSIVSVVYLVITKKAPNTKIPFGPFLALGAIVFVLYNQMITTLMNQV